MFQPAQLEKTEIDGTPALKLTMSVPQMPNMPPETAKMMERMYGPGGKIVAWLVPCNEQTVVFSYMSQEPLGRAIAAIKQGKPGLAADAEVAKVAALLPPGAIGSRVLQPQGHRRFCQSDDGGGVASGERSEDPRDSAPRLRSRWP